MFTFFKIQAEVARMFSHGEFRFRDLSNFVLIGKLCKFSAFFGEKATKKPRKTREKPSREDVGGHQHSGQP